MKIAKINVPQLKESAYDVFRYAFNNDERMTEKLVDFYKEGVKNPAVARLIENQSQKDGFQRYRDYLYEDIQSFRGHPMELLKEFYKKAMATVALIRDAKFKPPVKEEFDNFYEKLIQLYPKTLALRERLIADERVCLNEIKPCLPKGIKKALKYAKYF